MRKISFFILIGFLFSACSSKKEDIVQEVPKNGSIESTVSVAHYNDSVDIVTTKHSVYKKNTLSKTIIHNDTVPGLGTTVVADENDNNKMVKKDYDIYITVK